MNTRVSFLNTTPTKTPLGPGIGMSPFLLYLTGDFLLPSDNDAFCLTKLSPHACQQALGMVSIAHFPPAWHTWAADCDITGSLPSFPDN